ncbi:hypothetical protein K501DRAFT_57870 [Backusella circina FSU 941]|nr:hypothetical protein K501DRAFT_57870 [Backusella circina FSU 941]
MSSNSIQPIDALNFDSLDDWLENDLRQCGILTDADLPVTPSLTPATIAAAHMLASPPTSACTPQMGPILDATPVIKYQPLSPVTPKMELQDIPKSPIDLQPFIHALTILGSIQQQQKQQHTTTTTQENHNINNKRERSPSLNIASQDPQDMIALKRQRNTDAARRSRQRKAVKMESLEKQVQDLESSNDRLRLRAAVAESECANIHAKEKRSKVRILELETQLAEAHKALLRHTQKGLYSHCTNYHHHQKSLVTKKKRKKKWGISSNMFTFNCPLFF